jgi:hypothetical protein
MRRLQAQFGDFSYALRTVKHWIGEIQRGRKDLHDEIPTGRSALDDLNGKFWQYETNGHFNGTFNC